MSIRSLATAAAHAVQDATLNVRLTARAFGQHGTYADAIANADAGAAATAGAKAAKPSFDKLNGFLADNQLFADGKALRDADEVELALSGGASNLTVQRPGMEAPAKPTRGEQRLIEAPTRTFERGQLQALGQELIANKDLSPWKFYATAGALMGGAAAAGALGWSIAHGDE